MTLLKGSLASRIINWMLQQFFIAGRILFFQPAGPIRSWIFHPDCCSIWIHCSLLDLRYFQFIGKIAIQLLVRVTFFTSYYCVKRDRSLQSRHQINDWIPAWYLLAGLLEICGTHFPHGNRNILLSNALVDDLLWDHGNIVVYYCLRIVRLQTVGIRGLHLPNLGQRLGLVHCWI